jgi:signal transduction histidine kinase
MFAIGAGYFADREKHVRTELDRNKFVTSLGRITSGIVHDLKNPLISIIGLLERLAAGKGDCTGYVPVILQDAHRMERIVYDVLDFAKPIDLRKEPCNLSQVVKKAIKMCSEKADMAKISVDTDLDDISTLADSFLMERALVNVISNAIEASEKNKKIRISLHKQASSARIIIRDYGQGMDGDTIKHCFEPYFSRKANGTGLGLPIVKKIVEAHDGSVSVELPREGGTAFQIDLPL